MSTPTIPADWIVSKDLAACPVCSCLNELLFTPRIVRPTALLMKRTSRKAGAPKYRIMSCCEFSTSIRIFDDVPTLENAWAIKRRKVVVDSRAELTLARLDAYEAKLQKAPQT